MAIKENRLSGRQIIIKINRQTDRQKEERTDGLLDKQADNQTNTNKQPWR